MPRVAHRFQAAAACGAILWALCARASDQPSAPLPSADATLPTPVPKVAVSGSSPAEEGATGGYKPESTSTTGPWGPMPFQDTPYTLDTTNVELMENQVMSSTDDLFRQNPLTQLNLNQSRGYGSIIYIQGLRLSSLSSNGFTRLDGLDLSDVENMIMPLEDKERVDVLAGLSGFLYGPNNVGGVVNYILKRPTASPLYELTVGDYGGLQPFLHVDLAGPIDADGRFGYRLNLVGSEGDTAVHDNHVQKSLVSGAIDWHVTTELLAQANYSHQHYFEEGTQADWGGFGGAFPHFDPHILKPTRNYSQPWTFNRNVMDVLGANLTYELSGIALRSAYEFTRVASESVYSGNNVNLTGSSYSYDLTAVQNAPQTEFNRAGYAFLDLSFLTGPVQHKLTTGFYGSSYRLVIHQDNFNFVDFGTAFPVSPYPMYVPPPTFAIGLLPTYKADGISSASWILGDEAKLGRQWSMLLGVSADRLQTVSYDSSGAPSSDYDRSALSPSVSLLYKPLSALTTYVTYMQSLENPGFAATEFNNLPVSNALQAISPTVSDEYQLGMKASVGGMLLTADLFWLKVDNTYYRLDTNGATYSYSNDGRQREEGIDLTAVGKVTKDLTLSAGLVLLGSKITNTNTPYLQDAAPYGTTKNMAKLYAEYRIPGTRSIFLTGGINHVGAQLANEYAYPIATAREWLPSYTVGNVGLRAEGTVGANPVAVRIFVTNVSNGSYWQQSEVLGAPRSIAASASLQF